MAVTNNFDIEVDRAKKRLDMRIKTLGFFPPFDFQNSGRRMKILHVIVTAICDILLAQGL